MHCENHSEDYEKFEMGLLDDLCKIYDYQMKCDDFYMISEDQAKRLLPRDQHILFDLMYGENAKKQ